MTDKTTYKDRLQPSANGTGPTPPKKDSDAEDVYGAVCFLRGIKDRAVTVEFRFRDGNVCWLPNALMAMCKYDPSEGILLRYSSDLLYVVLIKGSNLDLPAQDGFMNLISGLQRHRVVWIREMSQDDIKSIGETAPTIDSIQVAELESHAQLKDWLGKHAPSFVTQST